MADANLDEATASTNTPDAPASFPGVSEVDPQNDSQEPDSDLTVDVESSRRSTTVLLAGNWLVEDHKEDNEEQSDDEEILVDSIVTDPFSGSSSENHESGSSTDMDKSFRAMYRHHSSRELQAPPPNDDDTGGVDDEKVGSVPQTLVDDNNEKVGSAPPTLELDDTTTDVRPNNSHSPDMEISPSSSVPIPPSSSSSSSSEEDDEFDNNDKKEGLLDPASAHKRRSTMVTQCTDFSSTIHLARSSSNDESDEQNHPSDDGSFCGDLKEFHIRVIHRMHKAVVGCLLSVSGVAVRFPRFTILGLGCLSLGLVAAGWFTNFYIETQSRQLWPPQNTLTLDHASWIWQGSWFNNAPVTIDIIIHKNGDNVLGQQGVDRVFEVQETFVNFGDYKAGCAFAEEYGDMFAVGQCWINSVADFWEESYSEFNTTVQSDEDAVEVLSQTFYPNGILVDVDSVMGKTERNQEDGLLINAQSYSLRFGVPWSNSTLDFERRVLNRMLDLREEWIDRGDDFRMEILSHSSFSNEFLRAIWEDLWLFPITFGVVILFTIFFAFGKRDRVKSRGLLGIGAVATVVASMMASFGILFCIGIPFTTQTIMVPFLMFGIGLDDAFILYGSYHRRARITDTKERINSTVEDVGVSIFLTTLTSIFAFVLGSFSHIPAVSWLCTYAALSIGIDFIYQITFFVALLALDERRIQQGRMDYCTCIKVQYVKMTDSNNDDASQTKEEEVQATTLIQDEEIHIADKLMSWWASQLLKPGVQAFAFVVFAALMGVSVLCATKLEQEFDFVAMVPQDSYLKPFYAIQDAYTTKTGIYGHAYFRDVDESDPVVQQEMLDYIDNLVASGIVEAPAYVWVKDFQKYSAEQPHNSTFHEMVFDEQMDQFLSVDIYNDLYHDQISKDYNGTVMNTRVVLLFRFDIRDSKEATDVMSAMREISGAESINQGVGADEWKFFTWAKEYFLYEFYGRVVEELIFTSVMSVVAVSVIAILFIPHWTAVLFVFPFITCLYVNMLGWLYLSGVQINAISYVTLVMSIGLMIDYIMHILMRYYESSGSRQQRVQETMSSVGASIFLGAASTFLGVMCLSLSTSDVLRDIFVAVVGLITFGVLHGLIFLPIALSHFGPQTKQQDDVPLEDDPRNFKDPKVQQQHLSPSLSLDSTVQHCPTTPLESPFSFTSDKTYEF